MLDTIHLEQSATCTTSTRAVTEHNTPVHLEQSVTCTTSTTAVTEHNTPVRLEQSATCTTSTRAVTERFHTCIVDAPVLDRPAPLRRFYTIPAPYTNALTYLLTYLLSTIQSESSLRTPARQQTQSSSYYITENDHCYQLSKYG